jgi:hypothetical protein
MARQISRRQFGRLGLAMGSVVTLGMTPFGAVAAPPIQSTQFGEVPTTGGLRPGPLGKTPVFLTSIGAQPVAMHIAKAAVEAQVETIEIVNGVMQNPTGPWIVSWYRQTARLGEIGNVVIAGHVDYWDVGPSVFYNLKDLVAGDPIQITGDDGQTYAYATDWNKLFDVLNAPIQEIVGSTSTESLTIITCGGEFDYATGHYLQRRVVRSHRIQNS